MHDLGIHLLHRLLLRHHHLLELQHHLLHLLRRTHHLRLHHLG